MPSKLLEELCTLAGAAGFETAVRDYLQPLWKECVDDSMVDGQGNLLAIVKSQASPPPTLNILFMAHMDEVGLIVRDISDEGFIHFDALGGQTDEVLAAQLWNIHTAQGIVVGYTGLESGHTMGSYPPTEKLNQKTMFIDIGVSSRAEAEERGIRTGLPITYAGPSFIQNGKRILARALDDRFGLAAITELLQRVKPYKDQLPFNMYFAATVQEELGMRGAKTVYQSLPEQPDLVINLDIGLARDYPLLYSQASKTPATSKLPKLGGGITFTVYDSNSIANPKLLDCLTSICKTSDVKFQYDSSMMGSTDVCCLQQSGTGMPGLNIGIPVRYAHSHLGMMDTQDYDELMKFLMHFCSTYNIDMHQRVYPNNSVSKTGLFKVMHKHEHINDAPCVTP